MSDRLARLFLVRSAYGGRFDADPDRIFEIGSKRRHPGGGHR